MTDGIAVLLCTSDAIKMKQKKKNVGVCISCNWKGDIEIHNTELLPALLMSYQSLCTVSLGLGILCNCIFCSANLFFAFKSLFAFLSSNYISVEN